MENENIYKALIESYRENVSSFAGIEAEASNQARSLLPPFLALGYMLDESKQKRSLASTIPFLVPLQSSAVMSSSSLFLSCIH
jgi:hypothetical protein